MTLPVITGLYAGILAILFAVLAARIGIMRGKLDIPMYHADNKDLGLAVRQHGNLAEWAPPAIIVIGLLEMSGAPVWAIHSLGGAFLIARLVHPFGLKWDTVGTPARGIGVGLSTLVVVIAGGWLIYNFAVA